MKKIECEITGICPLLQNRFPIEDFGENATKSRSKVVDVDKTIKKALYPDKDGILCHPSEHIYQALRNAGSDFIYEGKKRMKGVLTSGINIVSLKGTELIPMENQKYDIDVRPIVTGSGGRILAYRPKYNEWKLKFIIEILDDENISVPILKEILEKAGTTKGIGDYRPRFGRFMVTHFLEMK
jgi:hypothetical protein